MYNIIGIVIGAIIVCVFELIERKKARKNMTYIPESKCCIPNDVRLVDANELLKEAIGMEDGWYAPPKGVRRVSDLIRNAPTINPRDVLKAEEENEKL